MDHDPGRLQESRQWNGTVIVCAPLHHRSLSDRFADQLSDEISQKLSKGVSVMKSLIHTIQLTELNRSLAIELGQRLIRYGFYLSSLKNVVPILLVIVSAVVSVTAQTPSGTFFDGNSAQLGNSLRSITFFLAAAMIIAGIIFVAVGFITSGLRESLSTWKFITGAACFAFGGICAAVYAFSQGETVPLDNQF
jgi:hypothetical protein